MPRDLAKIQLSLQYIWAYRTRRARFILLGALVLLILLPAAVFAFFYANAHLVPMYDGQTTVYIEQKVTPSLMTHSQAFAQLLGLAIGEDPMSLRQPLQQLLQTHPDSVGLRQRAGEIILFAHNPQQAMNTRLEADEQGTWQSQTQNLAGQTFIVLSTKDQMFPAPTYNTASFWRKLTMSRLSQSGDGYFLWQPNSIPATWPLVYGLIAEKADGWQIELSLGSRGLDQALHTMNLPDTAFVWHHRGDLTALTTLNWPQSVRDFLQTPLASFLLRPGETTVDQGSANLLSQQLYADDARWNSSIKVDTNAADGILSAIVQDLSKRFPMAEGRRLPDGSMVLELKRKADPFLVPGKSLDVSIDPSGVITYPHNQFHYSYEEGTLRMQAGDAEQPQTRVSSCLLPDSALEGSVSSTFIESLLWTTVDFSVNQQKMAVCIAW